MSDRHSEDVKPPVAAPSSGTLPFAAEKYLQHMEDMDLTEAQKVEYLQSLWWIMSAFVDIGFGVDSVQQFIPTLTDIVSDFSQDEVSVEGGECSDEFNDAAGGAAGKENNHGR